MKGNLFIPSSFSFPSLVISSVIIIIFISGIIVTIFIIVGFIGFAWWKSSTCSWTWGKSFLRRNHTFTNKIPVANRVQRLYCKVRTAFFSLQFVNLTVQKCDKTFPKSILKVRWRRIDVSLTSLSSQRVNDKRRLTSEKIIDNDVR